MKYFLVLLLSSQVNAQTLTLTHVDGLSQIESSEMSVVFERAQPYFKSMGIVFRVQYLETFESKCRRAEFVDRELELVCLQNELRARGVSQRKKTLTYVFVDSWDGNGRNWFGGLVMDICGSLGMGTADHLDYGSGDSLQIAGLILAHEVGHLMCATHQIGLNLMNGTVPIVRSGEYVPVLDITKRQVKRWYAKIRKLA